MSNLKEIETNLRENNSKSLEWKYCGFEEMKGLEKEFSKNLKEIGSKIFKKFEGYLAYFHEKMKKTKYKKSEWILSKIIWKPLKEIWKNLIKFRKIEGLLDLWREI